MNKKGVTLVEIIFTIVLVLIVSSFSFASYRIWQKRVSLNNTTQEMSSGLMRAQQLATAAANNTDWGVHLEVDRYVIFSGTFYNEIDPDNIIKDLGVLKSKIQMIVLLMDRVVVYQTFFFINFLDKQPIQVLFI